MKKYLVLVLIMLFLLFLGLLISLPQKAFGQAGKFIFVEDYSSAGGIVNTMTPTFTLTFTPTPTGTYLTETPTHTPTFTLTPTPTPAQVGALALGPLVISVITPGRDMCQVCGDAQRDVEITGLNLGGTSTAAFPRGFQLVRRSTPTAAGTPISLGEYNTANAALTLTAYQYDAVATEGTLVDTLFNGYVSFTTGTAMAPTISNYTFGNANKGTGIVLRGVYDCLSLRVGDGQNTAATTILGTLYYRRLP